MHSWPRRSLGVAAQLAALSQRPQSIYEDLSKQAQAYREMSVSLRRPPGREEADQGLAQPAAGADHSSQGAHTGPARGKHGSGKQAAGNESEASGRGAEGKGVGVKQKLRRIRRAGETPAAPREQVADIPADPDEADEAAEVLASLSDGDAVLMSRENY